MTDQMPHTPESSEQQQHITQALRVGETPQEFAPPDGEAALVITHMPVPETDEDRLAAELQPLVGLELISKEEASRRFGKKFTGEVEALLVMRGATPDFESHTGYKGVRRGEVINSDTLTKRFGGDYSFNVGITETGQVMVENLTPDENLSVMRTEAPLPASEIDEETQPRIVRSDFEDMHTVAETAVDLRESEEAAPETAEHNELMQEVIEPLGETAIEQVEEETGLQIEPPEADAEAQEIDSGEEEPDEDESLKTHESELTPEALEQLRGAVGQYERAVLGVVNETRENASGALQRLEEAAHDVDAALGSLRHINQTVADLNSTISRIESGDYDTYLWRGWLQNIVNDLHAAYPALGRIEATASGDLRQWSVAVKDVFEGSTGTLRWQEGGAQATLEGYMSGYGPEAIPRDIRIRSTEPVVSLYRNAAHQTDELIPAINRISGDSQEMMRTYRVLTHRLEEFVQSSYAQRVETEELRYVARQLLQFVDELPPGPARSVGEYVGQVRSALNLAEEAFV